MDDYDEMIRERVQELRKEHENIREKGDGIIQMIQKELDDIEAKERRENSWYSGVSIVAALALGLTLWAGWCEDLPRQPKPLVRSRFGTYEIVPPLNWMIGGKSRRLYRTVLVADKPVDILLQGYQENSQWKMLSTIHDCNDFPGKEKSDYNYPPCKGKGLEEVMEKAKELSEQRWPRR